MIRFLLGAIFCAWLAVTPAEAQFLGGGSFAPPGTNGQTPYNNNGSFGAYSLTGDCSFAVTTGVLVCGAPYLEKQTFFTSNTGSAAINIPQGVTPTSPANGDLWTTSAGVFAQINGSTVGPLAGATGCVVTGSVGQFVYNSGSSSCLSSAATISTTGAILDSQVGAASTPAVYLTGTAFAGTGTTSFPLMLIQPSTATASTAWGTSGTLLGVNAHTGISNVFDFQVDGTSRLSLSAGGVLTTANVTMGASSTFTWSSRGALSSPASGTVQIGSIDAAAPVAQTFSAQSVVAGTSNTAGAAMVIQGSRSTGTGAGGSITIKTAAAGSTGTAQNAAIQAGIFDATQYFIPGGTAQPTCGTGCASVAGSATDQRMLVTSGTAVVAITVNFSGTKMTAPICTATEIAGTPIAIGFSAAPTTTSYTLTSASALTATQIMVTCF